jgi:tetrahydromethanopterin S-methyltransferase subunit H
MGWVTAAASVVAARQASSIGSYNQAIQNRNAQVAEQKAEALKEQTKFDLARFDQQFEQLTGQTKVATLKSGVELSGSALNILRYNAEQAEIQKDIMDYNSKVAQSQAIEQANFARMQGVVAKQQARSAAIGFYGQAAAGFGQTETGKSLLKRF